VKEYVSFEQIHGTDFITPKPLDPKLFHIEKLKSYDEVILIYIRAFSTFTTIELKEMLKELKDKKIYVIASFDVEIPQEKSETIRPRKNAYNFLIIDVWAEPHTTIHVWFDNPRGI
jgi:hypothetical protein